MMEIKRISWKEYLKEQRNPDFVEVHHYPWYLSPLKGEIGMNEKFRFIYDPALNINENFVQSSE